ncbi:response regulator transcription factor [Chitinibacter bivalviorum]|uniref:Response regulator transcription factor n=1 Tax=Chitinibacter bivalviorum TaxID=2739434 RepID=A0A7H9BDW1_9NEIS|nr:response regulator transcription factor [Chitinibacter bivalviorum]QLG86900.1 response regulator transcription factor [Chitinibacter bivalviorum]
MSTKKISCVIIDDDSIIRNLMAALLRQLEFTVIGDVGHAHEGLKLCMDHTPTVVLLDINLPESDGLELLPQLLKLTPQPKVIMVSSEATGERVREALTGGASGFVVKPFTPARLLDAIGKAVGVKL